MAHPARHMAASAQPIGIEPLAGWAGALAASLVATNRWQWEALIAWQGALAAVQRDLWEQWASRYAGGIPIDA